MVRKLLFSPKFTLPTYLVTLVFFVISLDMNAQCDGIAGSDNNTLNVCDIGNSSSITIDLNAQLGPHTTGGTWSDDNKSLGLNTATGFLNAQQIKKSGIYNYTYTVSDLSGCTDSAVVTVTIGGYAGVPGPDFSVCNDESLNLFKLFKGFPTPSPQTNGTWNDDSGNGGLSNNTLNTAVPPSGHTYSYTYTVLSPLGSTCASSPATVRVSIFRGPEPGIPTNLAVCSNEVDTYTNYDLFSLLTGADLDGTWSDGGLGEITSATDSNINIQNIYNTRGAGVYRFTYTVLSNYLVCDDQTSSVDITIEKQPDFTGATLVVNSDICEGAIPTATYNAVLTQGAQTIIADGSYEVTYFVTGAASPAKVIGNFVSGVFNFNIPSSNFQQAKDYTISIQNIKLASSVSVCTQINGTIEDVLHITPIPKINAATLTITQACQASDIIVNFGGTSNLTDGDYNILYNLRGTNIATAVPYLLHITGGNGIITIPKTSVQNPGQTTILITNIKNINNNCPNSSTLSQLFTINPLPDITNLNVTIKDICKGQKATVELKGLGSLTGIEISYSLLGKNSVSLTTIPLTVVGGSVSFDIQPSDIPNTGVTTFFMSSIKSNGCPLPMDKKVNFTVNGLPDVSNMTVTVNDGCPNQPLYVQITGLGTLTKVVFDYTISSGINTVNLQTNALVVTGGNTNFLIPSSAINVSGTNTLVLNSITNSTSTCSSVINSAPKNFIILPLPSSPAANNQEFCKEDLATVANLKPIGTQYRWYDSSISTTPLLSNTLLATKNYYLKVVDPTTGCESNATVISVQINSVPTPTFSSNGPNFCGADKPTIQNLSTNTSFTGNLTWYNTPTNGTAFSNTDLLREGAIYYGIDYNPNTKCISDPLEATVTLTFCNVTPDGLTIPDGFSPNGDGVNDTFKILDIEYLFPNFSIEIFNRYGNILFKGNINKPDWDGKNSNSSFINGDAATGVYFYIISYNKENFSPRQGQLYLNR